MSNQQTQQFTTYSLTIGTPGGFEQDDFGHVDFGSLDEVREAMRHEVQSFYGECEESTRLLDEVDSLDESTTSWGRTFDGLEYFIVRVSHTTFSN
jgi:hypothetical protein